jgi:hypothetical protein
VTSPSGKQLHFLEHEQVGQFAFTTKESGNYMVCFWLQAQAPDKVPLDLDWKTGAAAKDWASVAKKEKLDVRMCTVVGGIGLFLVPFNRFISPVINVMKAMSAL